MQKNRKTYFDTIIINIVGVVNSYKNETDNQEFLIKIDLTIDPKYTLGENLFKITSCRPTE